VSDISLLESRCRALENLVKHVYPDISANSTEDVFQICRDQGIDLDSEAPVLPTMTSRPRTSQEMIKALSIPEGSLIPAPNGGYHYVGPASSYQFANTVRRLVTLSNSQSSDQLRLAYHRQMRAAEFTSDNRATALEARVEGHPITTASHDTEGSVSVQAPSPLSFLSPSWDLAVDSRQASGQLRDMLPERATADRFVQIFFNKVHPNFCIFHKGSFQVKYESIWHLGSHSVLPEPGWICVLFMIFVLGAQASNSGNSPRSTDVQSRYLKIVIRGGLQRLFLTATLANVQALLLLSLYQRNAGERNTAWMLLGHAARMAIGLGIQRDGQNGNFDPIERNTRRIVWWQLHLYEQDMSLELGRPCATEPIDVSAALPDDTITDGGDLPPDYLAHAIELARLSARVKRFVAAKSADYDKEEELSLSRYLVDILEQELSGWRSNLPLHLQTTYHFAVKKHRRTVVLLHVLYHHLRSILGRPYILCSTYQALQSIFPSNSQSKPGIEEPAQMSLEAARVVLELLLELADNELLEGEIWHDFYYGHHASLVLSLPFLARPQSQPGLHRVLVSTFLNLSRKSQLAPTYRILINVSIQFAKLVGITPDDDPSRPPSPTLQHRELSPSFAVPVNDPWSSLQYAQPEQAMTLEQLLGVGPMPSAHAALPQANQDMFSDMYSFGFGQPTDMNGLMDAGQTTQLASLEWDFFTQHFPESSSGGGQ
jgi:proline utilization trans-activator